MSLQGRYRSYDDARTYTRGRQRHIGEKEEMITFSEINLRNESYYRATTKQKSNIFLNLYHYCFRLVPMVIRRRMIVWMRVISTKWSSQCSGAICSTRWVTCAIIVVLVALFFLQLTINRWQWIWVSPHLHFVGSWWVCGCRRCPLDRSLPIAFDDQKPWIHPYRSQRGTLFCELIISIS